tara:strand:+ start:4789 stop:7131 length:2343 start_codon:yes stop_codon:yes gene_type:complete
MYKIIKDPKTNQLVDIYSNNGKKVIKNYLNFLNGGVISKWNDDLLWGIGIEKEFPIFIGPYKYSFLKETTKTIKQIFDESFNNLYIYDNPITEELTKISNTLEIKNIDYQINHTNIYSNIIESEIKQNLNEFYLNYTEIFNPYTLNLYNDEFINWITNKIKIKFGNITIDYFKNFIIEFYNFIIKVNYIEDLLCKLIYYKLIDIIFNYTNTIFTIHFEFQYFDSNWKETDNIYSWFLKWYMIISTRNDNAYNDRTKYNIKRDIIEGTPTNYEKQITGFINWHKTSFIWKENDDNLKFEKKQGIYDNKYKIESDSGGTEIRTEIFQNISVDRCIEDLTKEQDKLKSKIISLISNNERIKNNNIDCILETNMASYYKPYLNNIELINEIKFLFNFQQNYTGENEINLTLPYLDFLKLEKTNLKLYYISEHSTYELPMLSPSEIYKKLSELGYIEIKDLIRPETEDNQLVIKLKLQLLDMFIEYQKIFEQRHINLMKILQLLSPLFLSSFTGIQYLSFGDNFSIPETSKRFDILGYRILTEQNIDNIYTDCEKDSYYYYDVKSNKIINEILEKKNLDPDENAFEFSVNRKNNEKHTPLDNKFFGFEWKVLDQYPTQYLSTIILFIILISQWIENLEEFNLVPGKVPEMVESNSSNFKQWIEEIIFQGWNSYVDEGYINLVKTILKIDTETFISDTCYDFLNSLYKFLLNHFKSHKNNNTIIQCFYPKFFEDIHRENLPNINMENYNMMMDDFIINFPRSFAKIKDTLNSSHEDYVDYENYFNR